MAGSLTAGISQGLDVCSAKFAVFGFDGVLYSGTILFHGFGAEVVDLKFLWVFGLAVVLEGKRAQRINDMIGFRGILDCCCVFTGMAGFWLIYSQHYGK